jgi:hypothetical protein
MDSADSEQKLKAGGVTETQKNSANKVYKGRWFRFWVLILELLGMFSSVFLYITSQIFLFLLPIICIASILTFEILQTSHLFGLVRG